MQRPKDILIKADNLGRIYEDHGVNVTALKTATCQVEAGDRIALVGPSGSGKSTLLQLMGGLDQPSFGEISWPFLSKLESLRPKHIGYIFQAPSLIPSLTVIENIELPLLLLGEEQTKARELAKQTLERIKLTSLIDKLPEELSGGQAQRIAVARVLTSRPKIILADEPTGQLDHPTAHHLFSTMLSILKGTDTALIVATHDLAIASQLNKIWSMGQGNLEVSVNL